MASQAAIFAETIAGMKKALKRKSYGKLHPKILVLGETANNCRNADSESDSSTEQLTNRGNKLRKKSRFVQEGQLAPPTGPQAYKKVSKVGRCLQLTHK